MNSTMTIVKVMHGRKPQRITIANTLDAMQRLVCGNIQAIYPYEDLVAIVCNEEGKLLGMEPNRAIRNEDGEILDIISGTFFICGLTEDDFGSLTEEQIAYYTKLFQHPETFLWNGHHLVVLQMDIA